MTEVRVIGAGLAGSEAAWQLAERGFAVRLSEMKPVKMTPAHHCADFAELVCSNSLRGDRLENAVGLLKEELRRLGSLILQCADATRVEAGGCLAVDRYGFSGMVTERIRSHPNITVISEEVTEVPAGPVIIATGPLTSDAMSEAIGRYFGQTDYLHFFDAAAPLVTLESIDMTKAWYASRYDRGSADYINCAMTREEYQTFVWELAAAEEAEVHGFEDKNVFEGCMPVEVMARRGEDTLRYGPLKPVGLRDPATGREPYAVVQLRRDNAAGNIYNLVGFQTHLRFPEQKRVFSMIPALHDAEFVRYGVMHRNTFLNSPKLLDRVLRRLRRDPDGRLCRADDGRGGLCRIVRLRLSCRRQHGGAAGGKARPGLRHRDGHRRAGALCQRQHRGIVPADECEFRHHRPARAAGAWKSKQESGHCQPVACAPGGHGEMREQA